MYTHVSIRHFGKKKLRTLIAKRSSGTLTWDDRRKDNGHKPKYSIHDRISIKRHIEQFPRVSSRYGSAKSSDEYSSPDLNFSRMYKKYKEENPTHNVSRKFYIEVFHTFFPK